jgi:quercetin dioxygenase-like cupin family protein
MNEEQFRQRAQERGYGDFQVKEYPPNADSPLHTHDFSVMLWVVSGHFMLAFEDRTDNYHPSESCELAANVMHTERAGPAGAKALVAKKWSSAPAAAI